MEDKLFGNKNISIGRLILTLLMLLIVVVGGTFAWLTYSSKESALVLTIGDINDTQIKLSPYQIKGTMTPVNTYTSGVYSEVEVVNGGGKDTSVTLFYKVNELDQELIDNGLKYTITSSSSQDGTYSEVKTGDFTEFSGQDEALILDTDTEKDSTIYYRVYLWVDSSEGEQSAIQNSTLDVELNGSIGSVTISGTNTYGSVLTANVVDSSATATYTYQWFSNTTNSTTGGTALTEATSSNTYTIGSELVGKYIYVVANVVEDYYEDRVYTDIIDTTVSRKEATMTVTPTSLSITYPTSKTFTYTYDGDGTVSCVSPSTTYATCSIDTDTKTVTVTPVKPTSSAITVGVYASAGTNYAALGSSSSPAKTVSVTITDLLAPDAPTIIRTDYNTFTYTSSDDLEVTGYYVSTSITTPSVTADGWTTTTSYDISAAGTYYVWAKDAAGNVSSVSSIAAYTVTRSQGTGSTLTTRHDSTSDSTGTAFTSSSLVALDGTSIYAYSVANSGYTLIGLYVNNMVKPQPLTLTVSNNVTIETRTAANTYTLYYYNGSTLLGTSSHDVGVEKSLTTWTTLGGTVTNSSYGWEFAGWSTTSDSYSIAYTDGQSVSNLTTTNGGTVNLYAIYKRTIYFYGDMATATSEVTYTSTTEQYWNTSGTTSGTHISMVTTPMIDELEGWTVHGWSEAQYGYDIANGDTVYDANASIEYSVTSWYKLYATYYKNFLFEYCEEIPSLVSQAPAQCGGVFKDFYITTYAPYSNSVQLYGADLTDTGYTFLGWNTDANASEALYSGGDYFNLHYTDTSTSISLYGIWAVQYTVNYYNGSTLLGTSVHSVGISKSLTAWGMLSGVVSYASRGWGFYGWSTSSDGYSIAYTNGQSVIDLIGGGETVNLYAVYSRNVYFYSEYGSDYDSSATQVQYWNPYGTTSEYYSSVSTPQNFPDSVEWSEYGWYEYGWTGYPDDVQGIVNTKLMCEFTTTCSLDYRSPKNLYAVYENTFIINYNANGGTGTMDDVSFMAYTSVYDGKVYVSSGTTASGNGFTRSGYEFTEWNTSADGTGDALSEGTYLNTLITEIFSYNSTLSITLYAQWAQTYTINYYNGSTLLGTSYHGEGISKSLSTWSTLGGTVSYTSVGWEFGGWSTSDSNYNVTYTNGQSVTNLASAGETVNLYAVYSRPVYFQTAFEVSTSEQIGIVTTTQYWNPYGNTYGTYISALDKPEVPELSGWKALGYTLYKNSSDALAESDGDGQSFVEGYPYDYGMDAFYLRVSDKNKVYAFYSKIVTINYDANGGTGSMSSASGDAVMSVGSAYGQLTLYSAKTNTFTKSGYTFVEWNTNADGSGSVAESYKVLDFNYTADSITFYAQWVAPTSVIYTVKHYKMDLDGTNYTLVATDSLKGDMNASVTPSVKSYTGFTAPDTQTVTVAIDGSTVVEYYYSRNKYYLDVNYYDGSSLIYSGVPATFDVAVNGSAVSTGISDYYTQWYYGSTYEISNIVANSGYSYNGVYSGSLSGTIGSSGASVNLNITKCNASVTVDVGDSVNSRATSEKVYRVHEIDAAVSVSGLCGDSVSKYGYLIQNSSSCPTTGYTESSSQYYSSIVSTTGTYYVCSKVITTSGATYYGVSSSITIDSIPFGSYLINNSSTISDTLVAGLYRYTGTFNDLKNNYVCFGTNTTSNCSFSTSHGGNNKYSYRIIGVTPSGQVKVIMTQLRGTKKEDSNPLTPSFQMDSDIINDINGDTHLYNTNYIESDWVEKIYTATWSNAELGTKIYNNSKTGDAIYDLESGWSSYETQIGLMYLHDYFYAASTTASVTQAMRAASWINFEDNDPNLVRSEDYEWILTQYGAWSDGYDATIAVRNDGYVSNWYGMAYYYRPVFYITSYVDYVSGSGTMSSPYIIS